MKNKKTMIVKIDWNEQKVLNKNLNFIVTNFIKRGVDFELVLLDAENYVIDSNINAIVNQYILDCKKTKKPLAVDCNLLSEFIENLMKYNIWQTTNPLIVSNQDDVSLDIIAPNQKSFFVEIPSNLLTGIKLGELMTLGPDFVEGNLSNDVIFNYILSPFYWFLYTHDLLNDEKYGSLNNYQFGLH